MAQPESKGPVREYDGFIVQLAQAVLVLDLDTSALRCFAVRALNGEQPEHNDIGESSQDSTSGEDACARCGTAHTVTGRPAELKLHDVDFVRNCVSNGSSLQDIRRMLRNAARVIDSWAGLTFQSLEFFLKHFPELTCLTVPSTATPEELPTSPSASTRTAPTSPERKLKISKIKGLLPPEVPSLPTILVMLRNNLSVKTRWFHLQPYHNCFVGSECVEWLAAQPFVKSKKLALKIGNLLVEHGCIQHVTKDHPLRDGYYFYRFTDRVPSGARSASEQSQPLGPVEFQPASVEMLSYAPFSEDLVSLHSMTAEAHSQLAEWKTFDKLFSHADEFCGDGDGRDRLDSGEEKSSSPDEERKGGIHRNPVWSTVPGAVVSSFRHAPSPLLVMRVNRVFPELRTLPKPYNFMIGLREAFPAGPRLVAMLCDAVSSAGTPNTGSKSGEHGSPFESKAGGKGGGSSCGNDCCVCQCSRPPLPPKSEIHMFATTDMTAKKRFTYVLTRYVPVECHLTSLLGPFLAFSQQDGVLQRTGLHLHVFRPQALVIQSTHSMYAAFGAFLSDLDTQFHTADIHHLAEACCQALRDVCPAPFPHPYAGLATCMFHQFRDYVWAQHGLLPHTDAAGLNDLPAHRQDGPLVCRIRSIVSRHSFFLPRPTESGAADVSGAQMAMLLAAFSPANLILLFNAMLCEFKVVLVSSYGQLLDPMCQALTALLEPMRWPYVATGMAVYSPEAVIGNPVCTVAGMLRSVARHIPTEFDDGDRPFVVADLDFDLVRLNCHLSRGDLVAMSGAEASDEYARCLKTWQELTSRVLFLQRTMGAWERELSRDPTAVPPEFPVASSEQKEEGSTVPNRQANGLSPQHTDFTSQNSSEDGASATEKDTASVEKDTTSGEKEAQSNNSLDMKQRTVQSPDHASDQTGDQHGATDGQCSESMEQPSDSKDPSNAVNSSIYADAGSDDGVDDVGGDGGGDDRDGDATSDDTKSDRTCSAQWSMSSRQLELRATTFQRFIVGSRLYQSLLDKFMSRLTPVVHGLLAESVGSDRFDPLDEEAPPEHRAVLLFVKRHLHVEDKIGDELVRDVANTLFMRSFRQREWHALPFFQPTSYVHEADFAGVPPPSTQAFFPSSPAFNHFGDQNTLVYPYLTHNTRCSCAQGARLHNSGSLVASLFPHTSIAAHRERWWRYGDLPAAAIPAPFLSLLPNPQPCSLSVDILMFVSTLVYRLHPYSYLGACLRAMQRAGETPWLAGSRGTASDAGPSSRRAVEYLSAGQLCVLDAAVYSPEAIMDGLHASMKPRGKSSFPKLLFDSRDAPVLWNAAKTYGRRSQDGGLSALHEVLVLSASYSQDAQSSAGSRCVALYSAGKDGLRSFLRQVRECSGVQLPVGLTAVGLPRTHQSVRMPHQPWLKIDQLPEVFFPLFKDMVKATFDGLWAMSLPPPVKKLLALPKKMQGEIRLLLGAAGRPVDDEMVELGGMRSRSKQLTGVVQRDTDTDAERVGFPRDVELVARELVGTRSASVGRLNGWYRPSLEHCYGARMPLWDVHAHFLRGSGEDADGHGSAWLRELSAGILADALAEVNAHDADTVDGASGESTKDGDSTKVEAESEGLAGNGDGNGDADGSVHVEECAHGGDGRPESKLQDSVVDSLEGSAQHNDVMRAGGGSMDSVRRSTLSSGSVSSSSRSTLSFENSSTGSSTRGSSEEARLVALQIYQRTVRDPHPDAAEYNGLATMPSAVIHPPFLPSSYIPSSRDWKCLVCCVYPGNILGNLDRTFPPPRQRITAKDLWRDVTTAGNGKTGKSLRRTHTPGTVVADVVVQTEPSLPTPAYLPFGWNGHAWTHLSVSAVRTVRDHVEWVDRCTRAWKHALLLPQALACDVTDSVSLVAPAVLKPYPCGRCGSDGGVLASAGSSGAEPDGSQGSSKDTASAAGRSEAAAGPASSTSSHAATHYPPYSSLKKVLRPALFTEHALALQLTSCSFFSSSPLPLLSATRGGPPLPSVGGCPIHNQGPAQHEAGNPFRALADGVLPGTIKSPVPTGDTVRNGPAENVASCDAPAEGAGDDAPKDNGVNCAPKENAVHGMMLSSYACETLAVETEAPAVPAGAHTPPSQSLCHPSVHCEACVRTRMGVAAGSLVSGTPASCALGLAHRSQGWHTPELEQSGVSGPLGRVGDSGPQGHTGMRQLRNFDRDFYQRNRTYFFKEVEDPTVDGGSGWGSGGDYDIKMTPLSRAHSRSESLQSHHQSQRYSVVTDGQRTPLQRLSVPGAGGKKQKNKKKKAPTLQAVDLVAGSGAEAAQAPEEEQFVPLPSVLTWRLYVELVKLRHSAAVKRVLAVAGKRPGAAVGMDQSVRDRGYVLPSLRLMLALCAAGGSEGATVLEAWGGGCGGTGLPVEHIPPTSTAGLCGVLGLKYQPSVTQSVERSLYQGLADRVLDSAVRCTREGSEPWSGPRLQHPRTGSISGDPSSEEGKTGRSPSSGPAPDPAPAPRRRSLLGRLRKFFSRKKSRQPLDKAGAGKSKKGGRERAAGVGSRAAQLPVSSRVLHTLRSLQLLLASLPAPPPVSEATDQEMTRNKLVQVWPGAACNPLFRHGGKGRLVFKMKGGDAAVSKSSVSRSHKDSLFGAFPTPLQAGGMLRKRGWMIRSDGYLQQVPTVTAEAWLASLSLRLKQSGIVSPVKSQNALVLTRPDGTPATVADVHAQQFLRVCRHTYQPRVRYLSPSRAFLGSCAHDHLVSRLLVYDGAGWPRVKPESVAPFLRMLRSQRKLAYLVGLQYLAFQDFLEVSSAEMGGGGVLAGGMTFRNPILSKANAANRARVRGADTLKTLLLDFSLQPRQGEQRGRAGSFVPSHPGRDQNSAGGGSGGSGRQSSNDASQCASEVLQTGAGSGSALHLEGGDGGGGGRSGDGADGGTGADAAVLSGGAERGEGTVTSPMDHTSPRRLLSPLSNDGMVRSPTASVSFLSPGGSLPRLGSESATGGIPSSFDFSSAEIKESEDEAVGERGEGRSPEGRSGVSESAGSDELDPSAGGPSTDAAGSGTGVSVSAVAGSSPRGESKNGESKYTPRVDTDVKSGVVMDRALALGSGGSYVFSVSSPEIELFKLCFPDEAYKIPLITLRAAETLHFGSPYINYTLMPTTSSQVDSAAGESRSSYTLHSPGPIERYLRLCRRETAYLSSFACANPSGTVGTRAPFLPAPLSKARLLALWRDDCLKTQLKAPFITVFVRLFQGYHSFLKRRVTCEPASSPRARSKYTEPEVVFDTQAFVQQAHPSFRPFLYQFCGGNSQLFEEFKQSRAAMLAGERPLDTFEIQSQEFQVQQARQIAHFAKLPVRGCLWKLGHTFKTWNYRYFDLGTRGLTLRYFEYKPELVFAMREYHRIFAALQRLRRQLREASGSTKESKRLAGLKRKITTSLGDLAERRRMLCAELGKKTVQLVPGRTAVHIPSTPARTSARQYKTPFVFLLITPQSHLVLCAPSSHARDIWMASIQARVQLPRASYGVHAPVSWTQRVWRQSHTSAGATAKPAGKTCTGDCDGGGGGGSGGGGACGCQQQGSKSSVASPTTSSHPDTSQPPATPEGAAGPGSTDSSPGLAAHPTQSPATSYRSELPLALRLSPLAQSKWWRSKPTPGSGRSRTQPGPGTALPGPLGAPTSVRSPQSRRLAQCFGRGSVWQGPDTRLWLQYRCGMNFLLLRSLLAVLEWSESVLLPRERVRLSEALSGQMDALCKHRTRRRNHLFAVREREISLRLQRALVGGSRCNRGDDHSLAGTVGPVTPGVSEDGAAGPMLLLRRRSLPNLERAEDGSSEYGAVAGARDRDDNVPPGSMPQVDDVGGAGCVPGSDGSVSELRHGESSVGPDSAEHSVSVLGPGSVSGSIAPGRGVVRSNSAQSHRRRDDSEPQDDAHVRVTTDGVEPDFTASPGRDSGGGDGSSGPEPPAGGSVTVTPGLSSWAVTGFDPPCIGRVETMGSDDMRGLDASELSGRTGSDWEGTDGSEDPLRLSSSREPSLTGAPRRSQTSRSSSPAFPKSFLQGQEHTPLGKYLQRIKGKQNNSPRSQLTIRVEPCRADSGPAPDSSHEASRPHSSKPSASRSGSERSSGGSAGNSGRRVLRGSYARFVAERTQVQSAEDVDLDPRLSEEQAAVVRKQMQAVHGRLAAMKEKLAEEDASEAKTNLDLGLKRIASWTPASVRFTYSDVSQFSRSLSARYGGAVETCASRSNLKFYRSWCGGNCLVGCFFCNGLPVDCAALDARPGNDNASVALKVQTRLGLQRAEIECGGDGAVLGTEDGAAELSQAVDTIVPHLLARCAVELSLALYRVMLQSLRFRPVPRKHRVDPAHTRVQTVVCSPRACSAHSDPLLILPGSAGQAVAPSGAPTQSAVLPHTAGQSAASKGKKSKGSAAAGWCFVAEEAVRWLLCERLASTVEQAELVMRGLESLHLIRRLRSTGGSDKSVAGSRASEQQPLWLERDGPVGLEAGEMKSPAMGTSASSEGASNSASPSTHTPSPSVERKSSGSDTRQPPHHHHHHHHHHGSFRCDRSLWQMSCHTSPEQFTHSCTVRPSLVDRCVAYFLWTHVPPTSAPAQCFLSDCVSVLQDAGLCLGLADVARVLHRLVVTKLMTPVNGPEGYFDVMAVEKKMHRIRLKFSEVVLS